MTSYLETIATASHKLESKCVLIWDICKLLKTAGAHEKFQDNKQLLDEVEQNIVICQWRADQLSADAKGRGK